MGLGTARVGKRGRFWESRSDAVSQIPRPAAGTTALGPNPSKPFPAPSAAWASASASVGAALGPPTSGRGFAGGNLGVGRGGPASPFDLPSRGLGDVLYFPGAARGGGHPPGSPGALESASKHPLEVRRASPTARQQSRFFAPAAPDVRPKSPPGPGAPAGQTPSQKKTGPGAPRPPGPS